MSKATRDKMRNTRMGEIDKVNWRELGIEKFQVNEYQLRFVKGKVRFDYYPTSGKYFDISTGHWGTCMVAEIPFYLETV